MVIQLLEEHKVLQQVDKDIQDVPLIIVARVLVRKAGGKLLRLQPVVVNNQSLVIEHIRQVIVSQELIVDLLIINQVLHQEQMVHQELLLQAVEAALPAHQVHPVPDRIVGVAVQAAVLHIAGRVAAVVVPDLLQGAVPLVLLVAQEAVAVVVVVVPDLLREEDQAGEDNFV